MLPPNLRRLAAGSARAATFPVRVAAQLLPDGDEARVGSEALADGPPADDAAEDGHRPARDADPAILLADDGSEADAAATTDAAAATDVVAEDADDDEPLFGLAELLELGDLVELDDLRELLGGGAGMVEGVVEESVDLLEDTLGWHRRVWEDDDHDHAQIEVHGIEDPAAVGLRQRLAQRLSRAEGVRWAEVNAITGRVAVAFDGGESTLASLIELIDGIEDSFGARRGEVRRGWDTDERAEHPADAEPVHRTIAIMAGDVVSFGWAVIGRVTHAARLPAEVSGLVSVVDNNPWLRARAQQVLGRRVTALVLPLVSAAANGVTQGPFGTLVDLGLQSATLSELRARQQVWSRREPEFYAVHDDDPIDPPDLPPRGVPLPDGPVERWSQRAGQLGLGAAGASYAATRSPRGAADLLMASTPRAARVGREGFATVLGRTLADRGIVPLDASALRRLDRIDTVVLDADVLLDDRASVRRVVTPSGADAGPELEELAQRLVDVRDVTAYRRRGDAEVAPLDEVDRDVVRAARGALARGTEIRRAGGTPLALRRDGRVVAVIEVATELDPGAGPVLDAVRAAGHRLVVADDDRRLAREVEADQRVRAGDALGDEVRALQAEGASVLVIGRQGHRGLAAADVGLGIVAPTGRPSWGADLILGRELADAATVVTATRTAAEVSRRAVQLAQAGSALAALVTLTGPRVGAGSRGMAVVNGAAGAALIAGAWAAVQLAHEPRPQVPDRSHWHATPVADVLAELDTDVQRGLTSDAATQRREVSSPSGQQVTMLEPFLAELANPLNPVLGVGAALSAASGSMADASLVLGLIGVNTLVGGVQRLRSDRTVRQLLHDDVEDVTVVRDGRTVVLPEDQLVRGDVLLLSAGDAVPADARVLEVDGCEVDESSLTGESLPVPKSADPTPDAELAERGSMLYEDTTIAAGSVRAVVVATGRATEVARSLALTGPPPPTGVEIRLEELTRRLLPASLAVAGATAGAGLLRRWPLRDVAGTTVSLAIASVPEGLPFVATAGQLAGARRLARAGAVVRNPRTVEALGRVDVLCVDKTGTLTEGKVALTAVSDGREATPLRELSSSTRRVLAAAVLASDGNGHGVNGHAGNGHGGNGHGGDGHGGDGGPDGPDDGADAGAGLDDADRAVLAAAERIGLDGARELGGWQQLDTVPFEASRGFHAALGTMQGRRTLVVKGAPEVLLDRCSAWVVDGEDQAMTPQARAEVDDHLGELARAGHRLLAVARRPAPRTDAIDGDDVQDLCLVGLLALADPVRETAAAAVRGIAEAGVRTIMVTGDHPETAASIARDLGFEEGRVLVGSELDDLDDDELAAALEDVHVVARVTPAEKLRIVGALQGAGHVVAMTGDGANDAAAIRVAQVGVALGRRSSSAARDAADIVVTDDRVETLIDALAEGRALWGSIREALAVLVGGNLGEIGFTSFASAFSDSAPLHPRQFLLVNLFTDLAPAVAIAVRPPDDTSPETLLREGPDRSLGDALRRDVAIRGTATAMGAGAAWTAARLTGSRQRAGTVGLIALVGTQLGQTLVAGGWRRPTTALTVAGSAATLVGAVQTPIVSRFFGSRPVGPVGWSQAITASVVATVGAEVAGRVAVRLDDLRERGEDGPGIGETDLVRRDGGDAEADGHGADGAAGTDGPLPRRRVPATDDGTGPKRVLVTGDGDLADAAVERLLAEGHTLVRLIDEAAPAHPAEDRAADTAEELVVARGRLEDPDVVADAATGCAVVLHLAGGEDHGPATVVEAERAIAAAVAEGADRAGVARILHLGALVDEDALVDAPPPTYARWQAGVELRAGAVPVVELRVGPVLGARDTTFGLLRAAARLPLGLHGPVLSSRVQPVARDELVEVLAAVVDDAEVDHGVLELAGPDVVTVQDLVDQVRSREGRARMAELWSPAATPEVLAPLAARAAGVPRQRAASRLAALRHDAVVRAPAGNERYGDLLTTGALDALDRVWEAEDLEVPGSVRAAAS
jgi:cation-transporting ATPase I